MRSERFFKSKASTKLALSTNHELSLNFSAKEEATSMISRLLALKHNSILNPNIQNYSSGYKFKKDGEGRSFYLVNMPDLEYQIDHHKDTSYIASVASEVDEEKLSKLIKDGIINFKIIDGVTNYSVFEHFYPENTSSSRPENPTDIDLEYVRKKFNLLMDLGEYFIRRHFFESLTFFHKYKDLPSDAELKKFYERESKIFIENQEKYISSLVLYTRELNSFIQFSIFNEAFEALQKDQTMSFDQFRQQNPQLLLSKETVNSLQQLQQELSNESTKRMILLPEYLKDFKYNFAYNQDYNLVANFIKESWIHIDNQVNIFFDKSPNDTNTEKITDIRSLNQFFFKESGEIHLVLNNVLGILKKSPDKKLQSIDFKQKDLVRLMVFGYADFFKFIEKTQNSDIMKALFSDSKEFFAHTIPEDWRQILNFEQRKLSYDDWIKINRLKLNLNPLLYQKLKDDPHQDFPENFTKNIWNLLLFTRDIESINAVPLNFVHYTDVVRENPLELFLLGRVNNSATDRQHADCLINLIAHGLVFFGDLKQLSQEKLPQLIQANFSGAICEDLSRRIEMIGKFEQDLASKTINPDKLLEITQLFANHLKKDRQNIDKTIPKEGKSSKTQIQHILNLNGFLVYLDRTGIIADLSDKSTQDPRSRKLLEKIDGLISYLEPNSKIYQDKALRDSERATQELLNQEYKLKEKQDAEKLKNKQSKKKAPPKLSEAKEFKDPEEQQLTIIPESQKSALTIINNTQERISQNFTKFDAFFKHLRQQNWLGTKEIGLYGSRVYSELLKETKPELEIKYDPRADFDFFCISEQIFRLTPNETSAQENFQELLDKFNDINQDFKIHFNPNQDKAVNYNKAKNSLNYKLIATFNQDFEPNQIEFDLSFYTSESVKDNMQWQYNFERLMLCQNQDYQYELKVNNHHANKIDIHQFIEQAGDDSKQGDFLYSANSGAKGYLSRIYHKKGVFKYLAEEEIDKIKSKLVLDKNIEQQLRDDYDFYLSSISSPDDNKSRVARGIVEMVNTDKILGAIAPLSSPHQASITHHRLKETITTL